MPIHILHNLPLYHSDGSKTEHGLTALRFASAFGYTDIVRELIAADGSVKHLRMKDKWGETALEFAKNDEIKALLHAAEACAEAGAAAPPPEGKAQEGEEGNEVSPPQAQGGAQPKKTLPRPVYEGKADEAGAAATRYARAPANWRTQDDPNESAHCTCYSDYYCHYHNGELRKS